MSPISCVLKWLLKVFVFENSLLACDDDLFDICENVRQTKSCVVKEIHKV